MQEMGEYELQGGSAFFPGYKQVEQAEEKVAKETTPAPASLPPAQTPPPAPAVAAPKPLAKSPQPDGQLPRRSFLRRSFDFYEDQIAYLTKVSLEERLAGKDSSMNAMLHGKRLTTTSRSEPTENRDTTLIHLYTQTLLHS